MSAKPENRAWLVAKVRKRLAALAESLEKESARRIRELEEQGGEARFAEMVRLGARPPFSLILADFYRGNVKLALEYLDAGKLDSALYALSGGMNKLPEIVSYAAKGYMVEWEREAGSEKTATERTRQRERLEAEVRAEVSRADPSDWSRSAGALLAASERVLARAEADPRYRSELFGRSKKLPSPESLARRLRAKKPPGKS